MGEDLVLSPHLTTGAGGCCGNPLSDPKALLRSGADVSETQDRSGDRTFVRSPLLFFDQSA